MTKRVQESWWRRVCVRVGAVSVLASSAALAVALALADTASAQEAQRPNILYIVADDLGWKDVGFHGSEISTPSLDSLAQTGATLAQFYVEPMCTPTLPR